MAGAKFRGEFEDRLAVEVLKDNVKDKMKVLIDSGGENGSLKFKFVK